jgi:hypothetical protein
VLRFENLLLLIFLPIGDFPLNKRGCLLSFLCLDQKMPFFEEVVAKQEGKKERKDS